MIYGYIRISTEIQSYDLQMDALKDCDKIYKETISGISKHRPEFIRLMADIQPGDTLKVFKLDRLGRSMNELSNIITHLKDNSIRLIAINDGIDTESPYAKVLYTIFGLVAELEHDFMTTRVRAGLQAAKERGVKLGKPYKWDENTVKQVLKMRKKGKKINDISKELNIPRSTIYKLLSVRNRG